MASRKIGPGKAIVDEVKGSVEYALNLIQSAFMRLYGYEGSLANGMAYHIVETFADHLIVRAYDDPGLKPDEYYLVTYSQEGDGYTFAAREDWEIVELTYQPQTTTPQPERLEREQPKKRSGKRLVEQVEDCGSVRLEEAQQGQPRRIRAVGITADVVNGNGRRYSSEVLQAAVAEAKENISRSSLNAGRFIPLLGEAEHPSDKASGRPNVLETVVRWSDIDFDGAHVLLEGVILETAKGRDILAIMEGGVLPGVSQRGYGDLRSVEENGQKIDEVTELTITGYDLVLEPSDPEAAVLVLENKSQEEENPMNIDELKKLVAENKDLFRGLVAEDIEKMGESQLKKLEESIREALGIGPEADLPKALAEAAAAKRTLAEQAQAAAVDAAIAEHTKGLPYGDLNTSFVEAIRAAKPGSAEAVKSMVEAKRKEYDAIVAKARLASKGRVEVTGPVIERETDHPAYARGAFEFSEALVRHNVIEPRDMRNPRNANERLAAMMLERFDKVYAQPLLRESRMLDEAETTSDLNLPYSASRAILAAAWPLAVAPSVFDFGVTDQAPTRVYYETYAHETGVENTVTDEVVVADDDTYVDLDYKRVKIGTVVVTDSTGVTTYTEGTDYVIDYGNGRFKNMGAGAISDGQSLKIDYVYLAMRKGENSAIERGKMSLGYSTLEIVADRLATEITNEAVVFSRSQIGWDATTRTLNALINEIRRKIDQDAFYLALASVLSVASNSGGSWASATGTLDDLVKYIGVARVKVANRYYQPTAIVMSATNSDLVANWAGFTAAGSRADAALEATGYVGRLKGLPVFESTEFSDSYIMALNRELVMARVYQPMSLKGPFPSYSSNKLLANDQWYAEEYNGSISPITNKGAYVKIT